MAEEERAAGAADSNLRQLKVQEHRQRDHDAYHNNGNSEITDRKEGAASSSTRHAMSFDSSPTSQQEFHRLVKGVRDASGKALDHSPRSTSAAESLVAQENSADASQEADYLQGHEEEDENTQGDDDGGVIRCICGINDDDGFTIQCDRCLVWQHCACFGMSSSSVPDEYLCELCDPRPVNVALAQAHQQRRKDQDARKARAERSLTDRRQSEARSPIPPVNEDDAAVQEDFGATDSPHESTNAHPRAASQPRSRKPSQSLDLTNTNFMSPDSQSNGQAQGKPSRRRPGPKPGSRKTPLTTPTATTPKGFGFPGTPREEQADEEALASLEKVEAWHLEFTPIKRNLVAESRLFDVLGAALVDYDDGSPLKAEEDGDGHYIAPIASTRDADTLPDAEADSRERLSRSTSALPLDADAIAGLAPVGQESVPVEVHAPSLAEASCGVYVKNISEAASAAIFTNVLFISALPNEPARPWSASRSFSKPVMHGLFAESSIPAGSFICEYRGELLTADTYRTDPLNQYHTLGATKPHVHLFPPPLNVAIDARRFGTEARFARYGCHPNAVIRPILFYRTVGSYRAQSRTVSPSFANLGVGALPDISASGEPELLFGLFALRDISKSHEIILGWEWDDRHIVHFLPELVKNPALETPSRPRSVTALEMADKGDFPYSSTLFSSKMNAATTALLGTTLCACIGSATPQGGSGAGSASSHNARKQDCAVAQMLRVGQGMGLMNVNIPGSAKNSHRRLRPPDFSPVVGIQRRWKQPVMPLTPPDSAKLVDPEFESLRDRVIETGQLPFKLAPLGRVARLMESDVAEAIERLRRDEGVIEDVTMEAESRPASPSADSPDPETVSNPSLVPGDQSDEDDEMLSDVSSLTEPLSGLSDIESEDDDIFALVQEDEPAPTILPLKKRVAGTRLKANHIHGDDPDREDKTNRRNARKAERAAATMQARAAKEAKRQAALAGRKTSTGKARQRSARLSPRRNSLSDLSSEHSDSEQLPVPPKKQKRRSNRTVQPSSPLTSAPDGESSDGSDEARPRPQARRKGESRKRKGRKLPQTIEESESDSTMTPPSESAGDQRQDQTTATQVEADAKPPIASVNRADQEHSGGSVPAESRQSSTAKDSAKRKKVNARAAKAEQQRSELNALADSESSDDDGKDAKVQPKKRKLASPEEPPIKARQARNKRTAVADSESEPESTPQQQVLPTGGAAAIDSQSNEKQADTEGDKAPAQEQPGSIKAEAPDSGQAPAPALQAEPEKPRAKLSLADWKKQQAEKRKAAEEAAAAAKVDDTVAVKTEDATTNVQTGSTHVLDLPPQDPLTSTGAPLGPLTAAVHTPLGMDPLRSSVPPAPLPARATSGTPAPLTPSFAPTLAPTGPLPPSSASGSGPSASSGPPPPLPPSQSHLPSPAFSSSFRPLSAASGSPGAGSPSSGTAVPPAPLPPRSSQGPAAGRAASFSSASGSPSLDPSSAMSASPPPQPLTGWKARTASVSHGGSQSVSSGALNSGVPGAGSAPLRPTGRASISASSPGPPLPAGPQPVSSGSNMINPRPPTPSAVPTPSSTSNPAPNPPASAPARVGRGFEPPPSPRGFTSRPGGPGGFGPPLPPAAPAALRNGGLATSAASSPAPAQSVPFNPPKGPKALMNSAPLTTTGSNAISIRGGGSPPLAAADSAVPPKASMPVGNNGGQGIHGRFQPPPHRMSHGDSSSESGSPPSPVRPLPTGPHPPQRHLSIMGRAAAATGSNAAPPADASGDAVGPRGRPSVERDHSEPRGSIGGVPGDRSASPTERGGSFGSPEFGGFGGPGGFRGRGGHHHPYPRGGGWGSRGRGGGGGMGANASLGPGPGWGNRGRGRGGGR